MNKIKEELFSDIVIEKLSKPEISVIIPAYNVEGYIEACLKSIVKQTFKNIEIIVIDDGSTDNTLNIINAFAQLDSRFIVVKQTNKGVSVARNSGLKLAKGKFISFIDSDDYIDIDYLEKLHSSINEFDADIAVASILKHKKNYNKFNKKYNKTICESDLQKKYKLCADNRTRFFYVWNKLYKTELLKNNNILFIEGRVFEDVMFSVQAIYHAKKIVSVPKIKYHYIERPLSIVKSEYSAKKNNDRIFAYQKLYEYAKTHSIELTERLNYHTSYWKNRFLKVYENDFCKKYTFLGLIKIFKVNNKN